MKIIINTIIVCVLGFIVYGLITIIHPSSVSENTTGTSTTTVADEESTTPGSTGGIGTTGTKGGPVTTTGSNLKNSLAYNDTVHGFSLRYPKTASITPTFKGYYVLSNQWRVGATGMYRGTPLISVVMYQVDNQQTKTPRPYPLYYTAEVRIGTTNDTKNCYAKDEGYTNQVVTDVTINGTAFKKFTFQDAAMMQYMQGESYRTIHNNTCYVIEQVKAGSSYRDDKMTTGTSDAALNSYYTAGDAVIKSFTFTK
jgi:hypothetical protein